ncbi:MAG: DMT family transporter [Acidimicrobiales bacterium]|nr:DMT family transporter [Acidimicrobiales bacterium]
MRATSAAAAGQDDGSASTGSAAVSPAALATDAGPGLWPFMALGAVLILWGLGPPLSKLISGPPLTVSFGRMWTSTFGIIGLQLAKGIRPTRHAMRQSVVGGVAFGINSLVFFYALHNASIATITVIGALQPAVVMLGAWKLLGEHVTRLTIAMTAVAIGGAALAVLGAGAEVHTNAIGVACSVGSLLCMGAYFLASKQARRTLGAGEFVMGVMVWGSLVVTPVAALGGGLGHFDQLDATDWFWMAVMLVGPGVGGQLLLGWAMRWVPVSLSAMIQLGATAVSIVAAWPIHGEQPTLVQLLGGAIALCSVGVILQRRSA